MNAHRQHRQPLLSLLLAFLLLATGFAGGVLWQTPSSTNHQISKVVRPISPRSSFSVSEQSTINLFEAASPSVVFITSLAIQRDFRTRNVMEIPRGSGSGFVWDSLGHIVTNYHVIQDASSIRVTLSDQSTWAARLVGAAPEKDVAVLQIDSSHEHLLPLPLGRSADLRVGQKVLAIGNPFGLDQTLTTGIISALGREIESVARIPIRDVIQTDAAINPGNSGGPLLDSAGRLIGINTAIYSPSGTFAGIGFAIPVDAVNWVVPDLIAYGRVQRPTLGVELASLQVTRRLGLEGALILNVEPGSPAEQQGLRPTSRDQRGRIDIGDVITRIEDTPIRSAVDLILALEWRKPGDEVELTVVRAENERTLHIILAQPR